MCGIAGALIYDPVQARLEHMVAAVGASAARGVDSFGVIRWSFSTGFRRHIHRGPTCSDWLGEIGGPAREEATIYLHTSRAEPTTEWRHEKADADIPPFIDQGIAVAHNGIIANDAELASQHGLERCSEIDTAIVPSLVAHLGVWRAIAALKGGSALAILDSRRESLVLCRNFMPLVLTWEPGIVCFASEAGFFPRAGQPFRSYQSWELAPFTGLELSARGYRGPIGWGCVPIQPENDDWEPFPALHWRTDD